MQKSAPRNGRGSACGACGRRCAEGEACTGGKCASWRVDWTTDAKSWAKDLWSCDAGDVYAVECPPTKAPFASIRGTDDYATSSPICVAGVHAGKIDGASGGHATLVVLGERPSFAGSKRNGVESLDQSVRDCAYRFR